MIKFIIALFLLIPFTCDAGLIMRGTAALRVWDEKFEAAGYDETWNQGETIVGSGVLDEDAASSLAGSPSGWGLKCLKAVSAASADRAYVKHSFSPALTGSLYFRTEVVVTAISAYSNLLVVRNSSNVNVFDLRVLPGSQLKFRLAVNSNGTINNYFSADTYSLNTRYRLEVKYDIENDLWEWWIDDISQDNGALTSTHPTDVGSVALGINIYDNGGPVTIYHDLFAIDDSTRIGAE